MTEDTGMRFVSIVLSEGDSAPLEDNDQIINHRILDDGIIVLLVLRGVPRERPDTEPEGGA